MAAQFKSPQIVLEPWAQWDDICYTPKQRNQLILMQEIPNNKKSSPRTPQQPKKSFKPPIQFTPNIEHLYHYGYWNQQTRPGGLISQDRGKLEGRKYSREQNYINKIITDRGSRHSHKYNIPVKFPVSTTYISYFDDFTKTKTHHSHTSNKNKPQSLNVNNSMTIKSRPNTSMSFFNKQSPNKTAPKRNKSAIYDKSLNNSEDKNRKNSCPQSNLQTILKLKQKLRLKNKINSERKDIERKDNLREHQYLWVEYPTKVDDNPEYLNKQCQAGNDGLHRNQQFEVNGGFKHQRCHERVTICAKTRKSHYFGGKRPGSVCSFAN